MTQVYEVSFGRKHIVATFPTFDDAFAYLSERAVHIEAAPDFPGCADAFTKGGIVLSIGPA